MGKQVSILLVEDDMVDVMAIKRAFVVRKIANDIIVASDGIEALEILRGSGGKPALSSPYIIILDLNMPRMSGLQFLEELRNDPDLSNSIVFVLTTSNDDQDRSAAYGQNIAGYITKSDFDTSFLDAITMLEAYWRIVEFP